MLSFKISVLSLMLVYISADTPANCTYEDVAGQWIFDLGSGNNDRTIDCSSFGVQNRIKINLIYPDVAVDEFNNKGFWTMIYNQGFEVVVAGRKYFGFSYFEGNVSFCDTIKGGWSHDVLGRDWACYNGKKTQNVRKVLKTSDLDNSLRYGHGLNSNAKVWAINHAQSSWKATTYKQFEGFTVEDYLNLAGGRGSRLHTRPKPAPITAEQKRLMATLPESFDWRNIDGTNFVSPVRNQASCGSCYAFGSLGMDEARVRIQTNNTQQPVFSTQDIVECSPYSQGCNGGFPYLISGKYAEDYGLVLEECNPYKGVDGKCQTNQKCPRHYFTSYKYVGGYYGACNEAAMMEAVYNRGPIGVAFEVYDDFFNYRSGVYHHNYASQLNKFNPFQLTNHAVLLVGWGVDKASGEKYWIVKNSWGEEWGQQGYFWIRRGTDECAIESIAVESTPIYSTN
ncbi:dipeptidyl peptidase 1-like isoform X2 [Biomphalaria glabrata]|nr:dipeptidyl peptidase 1-like isoform X2 [Biomphalaria glabrata]